MKQHIVTQKGETLIEVLAAIGVIAIVVTTVGQIVISGLSTAHFNENQTLATKYAQEGIEQIRQIRNKSYLTFKTYSGLYCFGKGQAALGNASSSCTTPNTDSFIRSIQVEQNACGANVARITVRVAFIDGKCTSNTYCHVQTQTSCLSTLNPTTAL